MNTNSTMSLMIVLIFFETAVWNLSQYLNSFCTAITIIIQLFPILNIFELQVLHLSEVFITRASYPSLLVYSKNVIKSH